MENDFGFVPLSENEISQPQGIDAFTEGGGAPISEQEFIYQEEKKKYETPAAELKAFGLGAARGFTFGLSDFLLKGIGKEKEAAALQAYQPELSTMGEVAGVGTGVFLGPGSLLARGATTAARPITSAAGRIAAKEAIEGAVYGVGQTISEQSLGSPESIAESLVANVGLGTFIGAGVGLGVHAGGIAASKIKNQVGSFLKGKSAINKFIGSAEELVETEALKTPINIEEIKALAKEYDIPLTKAMLSDSEFLRNLQSSLTQRPTSFGVLARKEVAPTFKAFQRETNKILNEATEETANSIGDRIKSELIERAHQLYDPSSSLYQDIARSTGQIELTPDIRSNLVKMIDDWIPQTLLLSEARAAGKRTIGNLSEDIFMPLTKLQDISSDLGVSIRKVSEVGDSKQAMLIGQLKSKVDNFFDRQVRRAAIENAMTQPEGDQIAKQLLADIKEAKKGWKEFKTFLTDVGDEAGLGKVKSFSQFMDKIESINNEKLAANLFDKKSVKSLKFVQESFPQIFDDLRKIEIARLATKASAVDPTGNAILDVKKLYKESQKYSPEALNLILGEEKVRTLKNLNLLAQRIPRKVGPSGTPEGLDYLQWLNPAIWLRDATTYAAYKGASIVTEVADEETKRISKGLVNFANNLKKPLVGASTVTVTSMMRDYEKRLEQIRKIALEPEQFMKSITENTQGLQFTDPILQQSIANVAIEASNFLAEKAPKNPFENSFIQSPVKWKPSDAELSKFNRYLKALDDPFSVIDDMNQNLLTPEAVESISVIYPKFYERLKKMAIEEVAKKGTLPFDKQIQLGILLQQPITNAQNKSMLLKLQKGAQANTQQEELKQSVKPTKNKRIDSDILKNQMGQSENLIRSRGNNP